MLFLTGNFTDHLDYFFKLLDIVFSSIFAILSKIIVGRLGYYGKVKSIVINIIKSERV